MSAQEASARLGKATDLVTSGVWKNIVISNTLEARSRRERVEQLEAMVQAKREGRKNVMLGYLELQRRGVGFESEAQRELFEQSLMAGGKVEDVVDDMWPKPETTPFQKGREGVQQELGAEFERARLKMPPKKPTPEQKGVDKVRQDVAEHAARTDAIRQGLLPPEDEASGRMTPKQRAAEAAAYADFLERYTGKKAATKRAKETMTAIKRIEAEAFREVNPEKLGMQGYSDEQIAEIERTGVLPIRWGKIHPRDVALADAYEFLSPALRQAVDMGKKHYGAKVPALEKIAKEPIPEPRRTTDDFQAPARAAARQPQMPDVPATNVHAGRIEGHIDPNDPRLPMGMQDVEIPETGAVTMSVRRFTAAAGVAMPAAEKGRALKEAIAETQVGFDEQQKAGEIGRLDVAKDKQMVRMLQQEGFRQSWEAWILANPDASDKQAEQALTALAVEWDVLEEIEKQVEAEKKRAPVGR